MRVLDFTVLAELIKPAYQYFFLLELQLSTTVRYTSNDIQIWYQGNKYTAREFVFSSINYAAALSADSADIQIGDADSILSTLLLSEDCRNKTAILSLGVMVGDPTADIDWEKAASWSTDEEWSITSLNTTPAVNTLFRGFIGEWKIEEAEVALKITNEFILWKKKPLRSCSKTCPWTFNKSPYTNLITGWRGTSTYNTLVENGPDISSAINGTTETDNAYSEYFSVTRGKLYRVDVTLTLNSGQLPTFYYGINAAHTGWANSKTLASGVNTFIFRSESTYAYEYLQFQNTIAANWSAIVTLYEVTECAYIGSELWCDQSYERCLALGNTLNYGGFRFAPAMQEKQVWWGATPK